MTATTDNIDYNFRRELPSQAQSMPTSMRNNKILFKDIKLGFLPATQVRHAHTIIKSFIPYNKPMMY